MDEGVFSTSLKNERVLRPCLKSPYAALLYGFTRHACKSTKTLRYLVLYTGCNALHFIRVSTRKVGLTARAAA